MIHLYLSFYRAKKELLLAVLQINSIKDRIHHRYNFNRSLPRRKRRRTESLGGVDHIGNGHETGVGTGLLHVAD